MRPRLHLLAVALAVCSIAACEKDKSVARAVSPVAADARPRLQPDAGGFCGDLEAICATAKQLMDRAKKCAPRSAQVLDDTKRSLDYGYAAATAAPLSARETSASLCAGIAKGLDVKLAAADSTCRMTADERARNDDFLALYYGRRTTPRPTGDATVDKNLKDLAAARDALCACTDEECERAAEKAVTAAVKPVPPGMTAAMEDGVAISDEVSRCRDRIGEESARSRQ